MRRGFASGLAAGLLLATAAGAAMAQDEELRMGDDPAYFERVQVPEAGIAVSFPPDWDVEIEMAYEEIVPGDPETGYWSVLDAGTESQAWCDVTWYLAATGDPAGLAMLTADNFVEELGGDTTAQATSVNLAIGEAHRVDVQESELSSYSSIYIFDGAAGRYMLNCVSDQRDARDWMAIAETLEWLPGDNVDELESQSEAGPEPQVVMRPQPYELERVEIPEAGIAMQLPLDWELEVRMEEEQLPLPADFSDVGPVSYLEVLYAESDIGDWCGLNVHEGSPLSLEEQAVLQEATFADGAPEHMLVERSLALVGDELGHQVDITSDEHMGAARAYLFETGSTRYALTCGSSFAANPAWQTIADSVEPFDGEPAVEPGIEPDPTLDVQRVELPDAGIALSLPADWSTVPQMEEFGLFFPPPYSDLGEVAVWRTLQAFPETDAWCNTYHYDEMPMSLGEHAEWFESMVNSNTEFPATVDVMPVSLPVGESVRIIETYQAGEVHVLYLFDVDGVRGYLTCGSTTLPEDAWLSVAESIESMATLPVVGDRQRIEVPEAGIAVSFPSDWLTEVLMEQYEMALPREWEEAAWVTTILQATAPVGGVCGLEMFEGNPLSLDEHVAWVEQANLEDPGFEGSIDHVAVDLPIGDAIRIDGDHQGDETWTTIYLFDSGDTRYLVYCLDAERNADDYLSIAETVELLARQPPGVPDDALGWSEVEPFGTQVPVADPSGDAWLMSAWCDGAVWTEFADGSFGERLECQLTDDPVDPPEWQGELPSETATVEGGACEWTSDFWAEYDGSEIWATSWSVVVEPDGRVVGTVTYASELLDCPQA